jgi:hypothetical protein
MQVRRLLVFCSLLSLRFINGRSPPLVVGAALVGYPQNASARNSPSVASIPRIIYFFSHAFPSALTMAAWSFFAHSSSPRLETSSQ